MAFLPLTDNRPGRNAYAADDILRMYDGTTVEITNTDAEGRLILADAIAYADQQNPELIIDAATLTGAAVRALGTHVIAAMQQDAEKPFSLLGIVGEQVCERLAPLPFWKEYDELLKSDVADMINCNLHANAGTITAGRFLAHFAHHRIMANASTIMVLALLVSEYACFTLSSKPTKLANKQATNKMHNQNKIFSSITISR